jgi:DNA repair exonuclease SbcCD ATPase subunit
LLLKSNEKRLNNIEEEITNCKIEKRTNELKKDEIIIELDRIEKLDEESCYYKYYIEAMDKDNIPSQIIKDFLPEINKKITNILERTVPFSIQVEYNENDDLSIILIGNDGSRKPIESEGGMANVIAGLSLRVALIELSSLPKSSLFAIDEQFSALDNEILSSISNLFDYIKRKFKNVLLITHLTSIKDDVNSVIEIYNDGKFSYVNV